MVRRYYGEGLRLDYILALEKKICIEECAVNAYGAQRIGFFGSDHSPIMLKLKPEWPF